MDPAKNSRVCASYTPTSRVCEFHWPHLWELSALYNESYSVIGEVKNPQ